MTKPKIKPEPVVTVIAPEVVKPKRSHKKKPVVVEAAPVVAEAPIIPADPTEGPAAPSAEAAKDTGPILIGPPKEKRKPRDMKKSPKKKPEVIEGEIVITEPGRALAKVVPSEIRTVIPLGSLILADPKTLIEKVVEVAKELVKIIDTLMLYKVIKQKKYVFVEGWEILGGMLGISAQEESSERWEDGSWESYVQLIRNSDGAVVGRASALCGMDETDSSGQLTWADRDEYARKSMSITRAAGKAYRLSLSWVMKLAGYEPLPAEEVAGRFEQELRKDEAAQAAKTAAKQDGKPLQRQHPSAPAPAAVSNTEPLYVVDANGLPIKPAQNPKKALSVWSGTLGLNPDGSDIAQALVKAKINYSELSWDEAITFVKKVAEEKKAALVPERPVGVDPTDVTQAELEVPQGNN